jgi:hypothetical protein
MDFDEGQHRLGYPDMDESSRFLHIYQFAFSIDSIQFP